MATYIPSADAERAEPPYARLAAASALIRLMLSGISDGLAAQRRYESARGRGASHADAVAAAFSQR